MKKKLIVVIIFTLIMTIAFFVLMVKMIKENGECVDSPFSYSAKKLKESGGNYLCYCQSLDPKLLDFSFSEEGIKIKKVDDYMDIFALNLTEIEIQRG